MRVIIWNVRRATESSKVWHILNELNPDIALLQEVSNIPKNINNTYDVAFRNTTGKNNKPQKFGTAVIVKGKIIKEFLLLSKYDWVNELINRFSGNLPCYTIQPNDYSTINVIPVYSPAWEIDTSIYSKLDVEKIKLKQNPKLWLTEILWSGLNNANLIDRPWIVSGDLNCSETFDFTFSSGNKEILNRMKNLGFTECLKEYNGKSVPTFRNLKGGKVIHQMDHLFTTKPLSSALESCIVGNESIIFDKSISDHLPIIADFKDVHITLLKQIEEFINRNEFIFAKTMPQIPHYYIIRDNLSENDKKLFDDFDKFIQKNGYVKKFYSKQYKYFNIANYKYWIMDNILNRTRLKL